MVAASSRAATAKGRFSSGTSAPSDGARHVTNVEVAPLGLRFRDHQFETERLRSSPSKRFVTNLRHRIDRDQIASRDEDAQVDAEHEPLPAHTVFTFDFERAGGALSNRRVFVQFAPKVVGQDLSGYGGRPDGAAVDCEGHYWVAMFEGARVLRIAPDGSVSREIALPVRCPTMPCFGGADLKTLYITTARDKRPAEELAREPLAGCVLTLRVDVPGLPANLARL